MIHSMGAPGWVGLCRAAGACKPIHNAMRKKSA